MLSRPRPAGSLYSTHGRLVGPNKEEEAMAASKEFEGAFAKVEDKITTRTKWCFNDLKMGKGKIAAQLVRSVGEYQQAIERTPRLVRAWENSGCAKSFQKKRRF